MRTGRSSGTTALVASLTLVVSALAPSPAVAAPAAPSLRLFTAQQDVTLVRYGKRVLLDVGAYVASVGGAFQINVTRAGYRNPIEAAQIVHSGGGTSTIPFPDGLVKDWDGLPWFLKLTVSHPDGKVVVKRHLTFCPDTSDRQRLTQNGPADPTFPQFCSSNPFTLGMVWGIDRGWAVNPLTSSYPYPEARLAKGRYTVNVAITPTYQALFGIAPQDAEVTVNARVRAGSGGCPPVCEAIERNRSRTEPAMARVSGIPTTTTPDPSTLPDLVALPAWGINIDRNNGRDYLDFGATVWNRGPAQMTVEGFRRLGQPVMNAWEYFYDPSGTAVGRARVGKLEYDSRPGHEHWHFQQFASYQLLDADRSGIVYSDKEGFCLAPTDAIDLAMHGADWDPGDLGFGGSVCGSQTSIWTRETLPTGWGDTYFQWLPGQSFDITHVRNGTYFIAVKANPTGELYERSTANNVRYRKVILGGRPGARTVLVPPWNGIDTEGRWIGLGTHAKLR